MTLRASIAGLLVPGLLLLGIGLTTLTGQWKTENSKKPAKYTEGAFLGVANPADIRGSYTFEDIQKAFDIPVEVLVKAFGLETLENPSLLQVKSFETFFGELDGKEIGTDSMRLFVALYKKLPYTAKSTTVLPEPARDVLKKAGVNADSELFYSPDASQ